MYYTNENEMMCELVGFTSAGRWVLVLLDVSSPCAKLSLPAAECSPEAPV